MYNDCIVLKTRSETMPNKGVPRPRWTREEDETITRWYPDVERCEEELSKVGRGRNRDSVVRRAQTLGLSVGGSREAWSDEENELLARYYPTEGPSGVIRRLAEVGSERTTSAVTSRAKILGVQRIDRGVEGRWCDEEVEVVKTYYPLGGVAMTERELRRRGYERTRSAINARAQIVGARKEPVRRAEKAGDVKVMNFVLDTVLDREIIDKLGSQRNRSDYIRSLIRRDIGR